VSEQAYQYHAGAPSDPIPFPDALKEQEQAARTEMLEELANFDDLRRTSRRNQPPQEEILQDLKLELGADLVVPLFLVLRTRMVRIYAATEAPDQKPQQNGGGH